MIKAIGTFLNTEHPGLTNVSDIFTVVISVISIVIAGLSLFGVGEWVGGVVVLVG